MNYNDRGKGFIVPRDYKEIDGLITNTPNVTLVTKYCRLCSFIFVDPVKKAIGLSHSGWKGTVGRIGQITIDEMVCAFNSNPKDIIAVIGPSICADCYEVGEEVAVKFMYVFSDNISAILLKNDKGRYQLNLWEANRRVLLDAGLSDEHIHISKVCTSCNHELLFSHRKTGGKRGSLAAFLAIKDTEAVK